ncbi:PREDICTED: uncharacterized protein LOC108613128 isoform X2 [Drosophila arizonae]|uniref:Uncharacterized protein LOC108613128 isoform X2 n=1 Tax=Drosophila arizonae TaxID=7263 RepID=A0ABM1P3T5_DROAR|nr:PREDICTED: uncharacterized protein LOC108613128 isoform X2 [Drosophila arizonae]
MEIRMHFALLVGICLGVSQAAEQPIHQELADLSHVSEGRADGHLVAHPLDCSAYFACHKVTTLFYCDQGLHFDPIESVCDFPEKVNCTPADSIATVTTSTPGLANVDYNWWLGRPQPVFVAVDVATGLAVSPMDRYDPEHIECRHFGAYFLPHPTSCQLYFICAYGHLHRHQCGRGTHWNYRSSECQLSSVAECYANSRNPALASTQKPTATPGQVTVCYIVNVSSSSSSSSSSSTMPSLPSLPSEREPTTVAVAPTPPSVAHSTLKCPSERQSYLPHPDDCGKYYICIAGMPVLTACPKGLYWDQRAGYCDQAKNVKCFQN